MLAAGKNNSLAIQLVSIASPRYHRRMITFPTVSKIQTISRCQRMDNKVGKRKPVAQPGFNEKILRR